MQFPYPTAALIAIPLRTTSLTPAVPIRSAAHHISLAAHPISLAAHHHISRCASPSCPQPCLSALLAMLFIQLTVPIIQLSAPL